MNPTGWKCPRRIGFLFPHPCDRSTPIGCTDCENGQLDDPYRQRHNQYGYADYDDYDIDPGFLAADDFTEADGETLVKPDEAFENDMSAS